MRSVTLVPTEGNSKPITPTTPLSENLQARLDIYLDEEGIRAVVTPRWGEFSFLDGRVEASQLVLTGDVVVGPMRCSADLYESWTDLVIGRNGDGSLGSDFTFKGYGPGQIND